MYITYTSSVLFLVYLTAPTSEARCTCEHALTHYEELGCKAVFEKEEDCCPVRYDCEEALQRALKNESCYFRHKEYKTNDYIEFEETQSACLAACRCSKHEWADFTCAHIDCPEFLGAFPLNKDCFRQYKPKSCCASGFACPPFDNLATCKVGNKTFYEGQRFEPLNNECKSCVCQKDFKGEFIEPFCHPIFCNTELKSLEFKKNCAPVYSKYSKCCPIQWQCQDEEEAKSVEKQKSGDNADTSNSCRYGNRFLKVGEKFTIEQKYSPPLNCECIIPPLVIC